MGYVAIRFAFQNPDMSVTSILLSKIAQALSDWTGPF